MKEKTLSKKWLSGFAAIILTLIMVVGTSFSSFAFSIKDITAKHVDAGIYTTTEDNTEIIITLFHDNEKTNYISALVYGNADNSSEVICGEYNNTNTNFVDDANGVTTATFNITDVYTNEPYTLVVKEGNDGSVSFILGNKSLTAEHLTAEDTVSYIKAFISLIQ